jgi:hypothetical protein
MHLRRFFAAFYFFNLFPNCEVNQKTPSEKKHEFSHASGREQMNYRSLDERGLEPEVVGGRSITKWWTRKWKIFPQIDFNSLLSSAVVSILCTLSIENTIRIKTRELANA